MVESKLEKKDYIGSQFYICTIMMKGMRSPNMMTYKLPSSKGPAAGVFPSGQHPNMLLMHLAGVFLGLQRGFFV